MRCPASASTAVAICSSRSPTFDPSDKYTVFIGAVWRPEAFSEKLGLAARLVHAEIFVGERGGNAAALRAVEQAELHQIRLVNFLDRVLFFAERRGERVESTRPAAIFLNNGEQQVAVHLIEAVLVDPKQPQRFLRHRQRDFPVRANLG